VSARLVLRLELALDEDGDATATAYVTLELANATHILLQTRVLAVEAGEEDARKVQTEIPEFGGYAIAHHPRTVEEVG